ncbi:MAG: hypothetical protein F4123_09075 [Gemmatimonadetes bacterium]|nr:hypothetical protein [Gemmatimonadota bacterium]MYB98376.1 hypothetical protein [Gemmatimonadota bacterium]MYI46506.1 hypothetical protein [Gemmatimonadota bacterium]
MNRLKLLAAAMLLALPIISACGDDPPLPPPTGSIDGLVSVEGQGQDGISVTLSNGAAATTANGGMFRFDGVEAGAYTVTISNYPDDASFAQTSSAATIAADGETITVNFPGTWIRTSAVMGTVTVENEGLSGVTVTITGVSDSETLTDANGQYAFTGLRAGNYTIGISGFDEDDVAFGSVASTATLAVGESKVVPFEGTYLRTSAITGQVSVEGTGLDDVTVSLQGRGEERTATTNSAGQYTFSELRSGDYSVAITNPNADQYGFDVTSKNVTIAHGETASVPFDGILLRTAAIMGTVTVEGVGLENVMVSVQGEGETFEGVTNAAGQFSFTDLHAGDYSIGITGFDDDLYGFEVTTATVTVALQETAAVPFTGIMLRTAGIAGTVTVEGHPISGVTVTVTGGPKDEEHTRTTNDAGYYMVDDLHAGDYAVAISDFDANEYEFEATTHSISVGLRETATVAFQGELLRTAGISGRVSVEGMGLDDITVTLSGDADMTMMTADGGQYSFTGLAEGDYMVVIDGWDEAAYSFEMSSADLAVAQDAAVVQNFEGMHTRTASVGGMLFLDEVNADGMHDEGEPALAHAGAPLLLQGPGVNDVQVGMTGDDGSYAFENLMAGTYRILVDVSEELVAALTEGGYRFAGELTGQVVSVAAAEAATVNFPFRIVMQTIHVGAVMGNAEETGDMVAGVKLAMYPTAEDADDGTSMLGMGTTNEMGAATIDFARAMDLGPGGHGTDHLVFVKVTGTGHADLVVSDNAHIEIAYAATDRVSQAPTAVRLLNNRANFQWWVKSDADAKDGDMALEGWKVVFGSDTIATGADGKGSYSGTVEVGDTPAKMTVMADTTQADSLTMKEEWMQSAALAYTHNPLALPAMNTAAMNDLGPIYITYTTQRLVLGVYREADDEEGYTDYRSALPRGDHRPHKDVAAKMNIELMTRDSRDRLRRYRWGEDKNEDGMPDKDGIASPGVDGLVTFTGIPADAEITVRFHVGPNRKQLDYGYDEIETFGDDLTNFGSSVGAFGEMAGAGPEVRVCSASEMTEDAYCATFGYQWMTGQLSGNVGDQRGHTVDIDPETGHGATGDDTKTGTRGAYRFTGLQDGEYSATASDQGDYTVDGAPTKKGLAVYHDEYASNKDEDKADSAWVGRRAQARHSWETTKGGLAIMGYVANDRDDNNLIRGDEGMAGLEVKLLTDVKFVATGVNAGKLSSSKTVATTETAANGLYSFTGLNDKTKYWVQVPTGGYLNLADKNPNLAGGSGGFSAQSYPALPEESTINKPIWNRASNRASGTDVRYTVGTGSAAQTATLRNFALLYTDGTVAGSVNNLSGSNGNIDVRITTSTDSEALWERATSRSGEFSVANVMEGTYTAVIEDGGFAAPCLNAAGTPDDDGPTSDDGQGNQVCSNSARTSLTGSIEGKADYQSMGTLHVYSTTAQTRDRLGDDVHFFGRQQGSDPATYNDTISWPSGWTRTEGASTTDNSSPLGTISYASARVTVSIPAAANPRAAGMTISAKVGARACSGLTCTLVANATGGSGIGTPMQNTITVTVTAANGYNDHEYSVIVSRADPVGHSIAAANIARSDTTDLTTHTASGSGDNFTFTTTGASSVNIIFGLTTLGEADGDNAYCAQRVSVKPTGGNALDALDDDDDDICPDTRYKLSASASPGTSYDVEVTSEDGKKKTYRLSVIDPN